MTFMRKFLDMLNMDNWGSEKDIEELDDETIISDESTEVTEEEIIESLKKQYYIVEEKPQNEEIESDTSEKNISNKEVSESEIYAEINKAKQLADIVNKTTDREEFYRSFSEIERILAELSEYEDRLIFEYAPSKKLREIENIKDEQIELLEKRIAEKEQENIGRPITNTEEFSQASTEEFSRATVKLYKDKFYEEFRYSSTSRKITVFVGNNFSEPAIEMCSALILNGSIKGKKINPNNRYSNLEWLYGVINIQELHCWLYENDYLRRATPQEALNLYKVSELKEILDGMGEKKSGNKPDLINRVLENIDDEVKEKLSSECEKYFISEKGKIFLEENQDYVLFHRNQYGVSFQEFCKYRLLYGRKRNFHDTIFQVLSEKAYSYQVKGYISQLEMIYHNLSNSLYNEGKYELSLQYALYRLYFSTNLASEYYLFSLRNVKYDGIEVAKNRIRPEETFNPHTISRIYELRSFFSEQLLNVIYALEILPYCIFGKYDMLDAIQDLYEGTFDAELYTNCIRINYADYIKNFL